MPSFDHRRERLLQTAARVFAERGYEATSMRDLSRATEMSLAGMYYYVKGKEDLLFQIQRACFSTVIAGARAAVTAGAAPDDRLAAFIRHHVHFFTAHYHEMKVLAHEAESLRGAMRAEVQELKREYVGFLVDLLAACDGGDASQRPRRAVAAYTLFGMMNWIYTWYDPAGPVDTAELSDIITHLFLNGYAAEVPAS